MSCIARLQLHYGMFAVGKVQRTVANNTVFLPLTNKLDKLAQSCLTAGWAYSLLSRLR